MLYLSNTIQHLKIDKKMTVKQIAENAKIIPASLSKSLNNEYNDYHISTICKIMKAMDCDITITISDKQTGKTLYTLTDTEE